MAVFGASERRSIGRALIRSLDTLGFDGAVWPVNPKYQTLGDRPCYNALDALPGAPDVVAFCTSQERTQEAFRRLPDCGAKAAVIYGGGYGEAGAAGRQWQDELRDVCNGAGIALLGPNCMGALSPHDRASVYMSEIHEKAGLEGNVGFVSQSGSVTITMLMDVRRFGYSHIVSSGNEAVVSSAAYLDFFIDDPKTKVIGAFLETVNDPEHFIAALDRAAAAGKPVVVLKVGRSARARRSITSHTGGLAGRAEVFSAVLRAHRAIEVRSMEEMVEVLAVCQGEAWPAGPRISVITASGGHAELALDIAEAAGLTLPALGAEPRAAIEAVTGPLTGDGNPCDAWGRGDFATNVAHGLKVLRGAQVLDVKRALDVQGDADGARDHRAPGVSDAIVLCLDAQENNFMGNRISHAAAEILVAGARESGLPHYILSTRPGLMTEHQQAMLRAAGQAQIAGIGPGLGAIDKMAHWATWERRARTPVAPADDQTRTPWQDAAARATINERDTKALLTAWRLPVVDERAVTTWEQASAAASEIGYPVVLKALSDDIPHKSDLGLVAIDLADADALRQAWHRLSKKSVETFLVQKMVTGGVEVFAGVSRDPAFGLTLSFGIGGVAIEVLQDFSLRPLPLAQGEAEAMIDGIRGRALLGPLRGAPGSDIESLARLLHGLSDFAVAHGSRIDEIDLNPIKVLPGGQGCLIVDALIVPRRDTTAKG